MTRYITLSKVWPLACLILLPCLSACRHVAPSSSVSPDELVAQYIRLSVALGERDSDSIDYDIGPDGVVAEERSHPPTFAQIAGEAHHLAGTVAAATNFPMQRRLFLTRQLQALTCRAQSLEGKHLSFEQESNCYFGITPADHIDSARLVQVRSQLDGELDGSGDLATRLDRFERHYLIPSALVPAVLNRAIQECRAKTTEHIALPSGEHIQVEYVSNRPWSGYSLYQGNRSSLVSFNLDYPLTIDRALDLACHETYPGHHTYNLLHDVRLVQSQHLREFTVQPTYSPQSFASEAAATIASRVAFPDAERVRFESEVLFPLAHLQPREVAHYVLVERLVEELRSGVAGVAQQYTDGQLEFERASAALDHDAAMKQSFETLKYINRFRSYVMTYTVGADMLQKDVSSGPPGGGSALDWKEFEKWIKGDLLILNS